MQSGFEPINAGVDQSQKWAEFTTDWRRPDSPCAFELHWRAADGFGQLLPRPEPSTIQSFYDVDYYTHGQSGQVDTGQQAFRFWQKAVRHIAWRNDAGVELDDAWWIDLLGTEPKSVLEIGCGGGGTLSKVDALGHTTLGIEPDPKAMEECHRKGLTVIAGTAEDIPAEVTENAFDIVLIKHVLEHCLNPNVAIKNASRLLNERGMLIVEVPNNNCFGRAYFGKSWLWLDVPRHLNFFTETSLQKLLVAHDLASVRVEYTGYCRQFDPGWLAQQRSSAKAQNLDPKDSVLGQLKYLLKTFRAAKPKKYDSVRIIATKPPNSLNNSEKMD